MPKCRNGIKDLQPRSRIALCIVGLIVSKYILTHDLRPSQVRSRVCRLWRHVLIRRSQRAQVGWDRIVPLLNRWLPQPRILHPVPLVNSEVLEMMRAAQLWQTGSVDTGMALGDGRGALVITEKPRCSAAGKHCPSPSGLSPASSARALLQ
jgi:hypothetical protein